jgi:hypothetical protein
MRDERERGEEVRGFCIFIAGIIALKRAGDE